MTTALVVPCISFSPEFKASINCDSYHCIDAGQDENVLAALLVALGTPNITMTATQFLEGYLWFVETLFRGIQVDFGVHPRVAGTRLFIDARAMEGRRVPELLRMKAIVRIGDFISRGNGAFLAALRAEIKRQEMRIAAQQFFAG